MAKTKQYIVTITDPNYQPEDGDCLDEITAALNHFYIPAYIEEVEVDD